LSFKTRIGYGKSNRLLDALSYMVESTPSVIKALSIKQGCVSCALVTRQLDGIGLGLAESGGSMKKKLNNAPTMSQLQKMSESVKFGNDSKRVQNLIKASEKRVAEKRG